MYILVVNNVHSRAKYVKLNILLHRGNVFFYILYMRVVYFAFYSTSYMRLQDDDL